MSRETSETISFELQLLQVDKKANLVGERFYIVAGQIELQEGVDDRWIGLKIRTKLFREANDAVAAEIHSFKFGKLARRAVVGHFRVAFVRYGHIASSHRYLRTHVESMRCGF